MNLQFLSSGEVLLALGARVPDAHDGVVVILEFRKKLIKLSRRFETRRNIAQHMIVEKKLIMTKGITATHSPGHWIRIGQHSTVDQ